MRIVVNDPYLEPYLGVIKHRHDKILETERRLTAGISNLAEFATGHEYFGLHYNNTQWIFREWAPNAIAVTLIGEMTDWRENSDYALQRKSPEGVWEIRLPLEALCHGMRFRLRIYWPGGSGDRIPAWTRWIHQDPATRIFNARVYAPQNPYLWQHPAYRRKKEPPLIYEAHIGMAQEVEKIGTFREFTHRVLPRIVKAGYNTLQLMALQEHPYYASFGYQISSFFAASSRFGPPDDLKQLIDTAHDLNLAVIMDLVHSHAVSNEVEGLSRFDGTEYQYFHKGSRGRHPAWDSRCFDYGKHPVLHFLLSNCRYWMDEFKVDGFRFDGVTSMLYDHHGLDIAFTSYENYFDDTVDEDALTYLALANRLIHQLRPDAITITEDVSGMPGLAAPIEDGGVGFDYRLAMGIPDHWIRLTKDVKDEDWDMGWLWAELTNRRQDEKTISYSESHDQALVGDQTLIFRMMGPDMYDSMRKDAQNLRVDRGMALHKMIRLITLMTAASGYLNFMGNEFGHPEWIDFPREGNNWSFAYARRQWDLLDDPNLKYELLGAFDRDMLKMVTVYKLLKGESLALLREHNDDKVIAFERSGSLAVFNFHPEQSYTDYGIEVPTGSYRICLDTDSTAYGGFGRVSSDIVYRTEKDSANSGKTATLRLYLPARTAFVILPS